MKKIVVILVLCGLAYAAMAPPGGSRTGRDFDPERLAGLEVEMWQDYYAKENLRLFRRLVVMLREQYNYSWTTAVRSAVYLTSAAASFAGSGGSYYETVLPDLVGAYTLARDWSGAGYDPATVARAELDWWAARRDPDTSSPANVGRLMAIEYGLLYEMPPGVMERAALLRAEAAAQRDDEAEAPDWDAIGRLLEESYVELKAVVGPEP